MINVDTEFQPVRRVKFDPETNTVELFFSTKDTIRIQEGSPDGGKHTVSIRLAKLHYHPRFVEGVGEYEVFPAVIGSGVIPIINRTFFLLEVRPHTYFSHQGKFSVFGGIMKKGSHPFKNAKREFGEEVIMYDLKSRKLLTFDFNKSMIDYQVNMLKYHGFDVDGVEFLDYMFMDFGGAQRIKSVYDDGSVEESIGYIHFTREPITVDVFYPLVVLDKVDLENLIIVHHEMGGEMSVLLHYKQIPFLRPSYFYKTLHSLLVDIGKNMGKIRHKYL